jgi:hypothetical protein
MQIPNSVEPTKLRDAVAQWVPKVVSVYFFFALGSANGYIQVPRISKEWRDYS